MLQQGHAGGRGQAADERRQADQPQVMGLDKATDDLEHTNLAANVAEWTEL
jgi:hypothetical protein